LPHPMAPICRFPERTALKSDANRNTKGDNGSGNLTPFMRVTGGLFRAERHMPLQQSLPSKAPGDLSPVDVDVSPALQRRLRFGWQGLDPQRHECLRILPRQPRHAIYTPTFPNVIRMDSLSAPENSCAPCGGQAGRQNGLLLNAWSSVAHERHSTWERRNSTDTDALFSPWEDLRASHVFHSQGPRSQSPVQFSTFRRRKHQSFCSHQSIRLKLYPFLMV
jgi:hypothetical protein